MQFPHEDRPLESYDPDKGVTLAQLIFDNSTHLLFDASTDGAGSKILLIHHLLELLPDISLAADPEIYVRMEDGRTIILRETHHCSKVSSLLCLNVLTPICPS
jgi:hypothetical protein